MPLPVKIPFYIVKLFLKTPAEGAKTSIYLATSDEVSNITGKYYAESKDVTNSLKSYVSDPEKAKQFWEKSLKYVKLEDNDPKI